MRHIKSYANDNAIQEAVDSQALGKPYVALDENTGKIDWNTKIGVERRIIATYEFENILFNPRTSEPSTPWFTKVEHNGQDVTDLIDSDGFYNGTWESGPQTFYFSFSGDDLSMTDESGFGLFYDVYPLSELALPDHVTAIGNNFCNNCRNLQTVRLPEGLTTIPVGAFSGCYSLANFNIPASVTTIKEYAFASVNAYNSMSPVDLVLPSTLQLIERSAFNNSEFNSVFIPSGVTIQNGYTGEYTFGGDSMPLNITIENGRTTLSDWLAGTVSLTTTIPASVTSIGHNSLKGEEITMEGTTPPSVQTDSFPGDGGFLTIHIPCNTYSTYSNATNWSTYTSHLDDPCYTPDEGGSGSSEGWGEDEG